MHPMNQLIAAAIVAQGHGTQARIARALSVEPQTVTKWKKGEMRPDRSKWPELERLLDLEAGSLEATMRWSTADQADRWQAIRSAGGELVEPTEASALTIHLLRSVLADTLDLRRAVGAIEQQLSKLDDLPSRSELAEELAGLAKDVRDLGANVAAPPTAARPRRGQRSPAKPAPK